MPAAVPEGFVADAPAGFLPDSQDAQPSYPTGFIPDETYSLTPAIPEPGTSTVAKPRPVLAPFAEPFPEPKAEAARQAIEQQLTPEDLRNAAARFPVEQLGQPAIIPRFGAEGTVARGVSETISGLGEFAVNKPEEFAASLYPPTAAAIALRYTPEIAKQWLEDVYHGYKGDKQAAGRAIAVLGAIGGPLAVKRSLRAISDAKADVAYRQQYADIVDRMARESLRIKDQPALVVLPESARELGKTGATTPSEITAPETKGVADALPLREAKTVPVETPPGDRAKVGAQVREQAPEKPPQEAPVTGWNKDSEIRRNPEGYYEHIENGEVVNADRDFDSLMRTWSESNAGYSTRIVETKPGQFDLFLKDPGDADASHELVPYDAKSKAKPSLPPPQETQVTPARFEPEKPPVIETTPTQEAGPGIIGMGGATPEEFRPSAEGATAMKYRRIDAERAQRGLEPIPKPESRTDQAVWDKAMAAVDADPSLPERLVTELRSKPRPISDLENHVLLLRKIDLRNEYAKSTRDIAQAFEDGRTDDVTAAQIRRTEWSDQLTELEEASRLSGSERGRALRSLRVMADEEFNLAEMEADMRASVGGRRLTSAEMAEVERIHKDYQEKIAALEKQSAESDRRRVEAETRATLAELGRQAAEAKVPPPHIQRLINKVGETIHSRANAARERLKGKLFTLSPDVLKDLAEIGADNIWTIGEDFAKWSSKMIADIGEHVKPHLQTVWESAKKLVEDTWTEGIGKKTPKIAKEVELAKQTVKKGDTPQQKITKLTARIQDKFSKGKQNEITPSVQRLARALVESGITGREALIDAVHDVLKQILPGFWTRRMTMDAISGYGDYKALTKDEISVKLRDLKGQMQQMGKLEDMAERKAPLRTGLERREPTPEESKLIKLVNEAKRKGGYETTDPTRQLRTALDEVKKRTQTMIDEYERRIAEEDFAVRKLEPVKPDTQLLQRQAELKRVRKEWEQAKREHELANRKGWQRALDRAVRWERAFKLSSPVVFGKLTAAALTRVAETAATESAGAVLGLIPGIRQVAKQAPREGGINVPAMAKAVTEAVSRGMKDAWETGKTGASNLDIVYGEKLVDWDWANVFGQLHGMLKAPVKRAEFTLSLEKRIQHAIRNGIDVTDPLVMTRLSTEALSDGYRSIFMQRGFSSDMFSTLVNLMEKSKKYQPIGEISARTLRFLLPVVRVPVNIVGETMTGVYGAPVASVRTLLHVAGGTLTKLDPVVADSIMRQFKKGSIGLGLMAIGYFNADSIGGYDWREKRRPGEVKTGGFQVAGWDVPRWLTHAPWFELMQFGATIRRMMDKHAAGIPEGVSAAMLGLIEETPFTREMLETAKLFGTPQERQQYLGELAKSSISPQLVQQLAAWSDDYTKRKPRTIMEHVKMGLPGFREEVPRAPVK